MPRLEVCAVMSDEPFIFSMGSSLDVFALGGLGFEFCVFCRWLEVCFSEWPFINDLY